MEKSKGFTIVELIISITLLVILWTVSVMSYTSYLAWVRDTKRISDLESLNKALTIYRTKYKLPNPEDFVNIIWDLWSVISSQWYLWKSAMMKVWFTDGWIDPLDKKYYTYYRTSNARYFQLMALLENKNKLLSPKTLFNKN
jgi:prepilin-type N-terminal cleavage/methylation domain-containing protein